MVAQCSICLSAFKNPVCLPCGHIYCKPCLNDHVNVPANRGMTSTCPDCRASFHLVVPDLTYLPEKYHPFISHAIRRVYIDTSAFTALEKQLRQTETRLARKADSEEDLMQRCENLTAAVDAHRIGEREANDRILELEEELDDRTRECYAHETQMKLLTDRCKALELDNNAYRAKYKNAKGKLVESQKSTKVAVSRILELEEKLEAQQESPPSLCLSDAVLHTSDEDSDPGAFHSRRRMHKRPVIPPAPVTPVNRPVKPLPRRRLLRRPKIEVDYDSSSLSPDEDRKRPRLRCT